MHNINLSSYIYNIDRSLLYPSKSHTYGTLNVSLIERRTTCLWEHWYQVLFLIISSKILLLKFIDFIGMPSYQLVLISWIMNIYWKLLHFFSWVSPCIFVQFILANLSSIQPVEVSASFFLLLHSISIGVILL